MPRQRLTLFDLDNTLLTGDSDVLWCDFLIKQGMLDRDEFSARNADMDARYKAGTVSARAFSEFYVGTLAGRRVADCEALRAMFLIEEIAPRITQSAHALVRQHIGAGDLVVMTTATNRYITELTSRHLSIGHLIATEPEVVNGVFTGSPLDELNMREGKVVRLAAWLAVRGVERRDFYVTAYSDSINDLPLLQFADTPVAVSPDAKLHAWATEHGHRIIHLQ